ncbi:MAG: hypothetical protein QRY72_03340 [Candidatus Rhabdochlamydia sp.]
MKPSHFNNQSVLDHLKQARAKGHRASLETHGIEISGPLAAALDAARETAIVIGLSTLLLSPSFPLLAMMCLGLLVWKAGRAALLGWARLERLHRLMTEERSEILNNRKEEELELKELYAAKGLSGQLLDDVVTVLSCDDNRLLEVMLEEELGLSLGTHPHPLEQSVGAAFGVITASSLLLLTQLLPHPCFLLCVALIMIVASSWMAIKEKNSVLDAVIWNLSLTTFVLTLAFLLKGFL